MSRAIAFNCFNHNSPLDADGNNQEESKMAHKRRKISNRADLSIAATCVRIPVPRARCDSINLGVAGDQLRKGSALNAVQIAERLLKST